MINPIGPVPTPLDSAADFNTKAFGLLAQLPGFVTETNATADTIQINADILAAVMLGMAFPEYAGTSSSSVAVGTGPKVFPTQTGKLWVPGQIVVISSGGNILRGPVVSYTGGNLTVNVTSTVGSGTYTAWTIGLTFEGLLLAKSGDNADITALLNASGIRVATRADVASAGTVVLTAAPDDIQITGTTAITGFTVPVGRVLRVRFAASLTLTNGAGLVTQTGANIVTQAGDTCILRATAANVVEVLSYSRVAQATFAVAVATTSGTAIDFTSIPSWVNEIDVIQNAVSTTGASSNALLVQIGSGSVQTTGYLSYAGGINNANQTATVSSTAGLLATTGAGAASTHSGILSLKRISGNTWVASGSGGGLDGTGTSNIARNAGGTVTLGGTLDRLRYTTTGTDPFDAGSVNLVFRG